ncbi:hypothetical protein WJX81_002741 [Elliptochloris bilobata]|uniref:UBA domain-containing protein n=1 Tax=Elliptochloris bilobata TaxID=381761 RepID=A0AAW1RE74_9CHLO
MATVQAAPFLSTVVTALCRHLDQHGPAALATWALSQALLLRSVAEAQSHGEATGHSNFEESTEAVLTLECTECSKPCRSQTEKDLHTKRTGHAAFRDKTASAAPLDTEAQVKEAASAMKEDGEPTASTAPDAEVEMVAPEVDAALKQQLEDMGFTANRAMRALHGSGAAGVEAAVAWIMDHENDADLDEPLLVPKGAPPKPKLSAEEARKHAEEMIRKAKERREKEERELERLREAERIRAGRELLQAKRQEDDLKLKRNIEERRREKAEDERAREKIRAKVDEDRRARRRKMGLPEELTEEEKAAEAAKAAEKERAKVANAFVPIKPVTQISRLRELLVGMKKRYASEDERVKTCWSTLLKYIGNVARDPRQDKFRRIRQGNAAFQARVGGLEGGVAVLELLGFARQAADDALVLPADKVNLELLQAAGGLLHDACTNPFFGAL